MDVAFTVRSKFVTPMFYGGGATIEPGDDVEALLDEVRVRIAVTAVAGDDLTGTVRELNDDAHARREYGGLTVGDTVALRGDHVRACWKARAA